MPTLVRELSVELLLSLDADPAADPVSNTPVLLPTHWLPAAVEALHAFRDHG